MINGDINKITEQDLQQLIEDSVLESQTLEYKQFLPSDNKEEKIKFLAAVSSFANASGGDLIYGIRTEDGIPTSLDGLDIEIDKLDQTISKLECMIGDSIEPKISSLVKTQPITLSNSKFALTLIIRIQRSWNKPHRVNFDKHYAFYSRRSNGKYPLDVGELRTIFNLSDTLAERIRRFREDRISSIIADETFIPLGENPKIVLHLIPLISFELGQKYDINIVEIKLGSGRERYNLDGFLTYCYYKDTVSGFYTQLFRNGIIEDVDGDMIPSRKNNKMIISIAHFRSKMIESLKCDLATMKKLFIEPPILIFLSILDVKGYIIDDTNYRIYPIDRDNLLLPEAIIESYDEPVEKILKPCFDSLWNACGLQRDPNYDENGNWKGRLF